MSTTEWREQMLAAERAMRDRLVAFGWRSDHDHRDTGKDGVEVEGHETVGDYFQSERRTYLRVHECPKCGAAVLDRGVHMDWHDGIGR